ncbi:hypothetical protein [Bryobacter aggregatus]|uniref:hypothetical protein n=1 Tax=Bryobacter aggregatus TaxID=360054 RepID=UPI0004E1633B|nr:hypothetical protein [Bryobacter aggregatus]
MCPKSAQLRASVVGSESDHPSLSIQSLPGEATVLTIQGPFSYKNYKGVRIRGLQWNPASDHIYFLSSFTDTSYFLVRCDLKGACISLIDNLESLDVLQTGPYKGHIVARERRFKWSDRWSWYWLLDADGKELGPIGDEFDLAAFRKQQDRTPPPVTRLDLPILRSILQSPSDRSPSGQWLASVDEATLRITANPDGRLHRNIDGPFFLGNHRGTTISSPQWNQTSDGIRFQGKSVGLQSRFKFVGEWVWYWLFNPDCSVNQPLGEIDNYADFLRSGNTLNRIGLPSRRNWTTIILY